MLHSSKEKERKKERKKESKKARSKSIMRGGSVSTLLGLWYGTPGRLYLTIEKGEVFVSAFLVFSRRGYPAGEAALRSSTPPPRFPEDVLISSMLGAAEAHRPICVVAVIKRAAYIAVISSSSFFLSWGQEPNSIS